jgi:transposase
MAIAACESGAVRKMIVFQKWNGAGAVPPPLPTGQEKTAQSRARRVECHQQVWALHHQGWPGRAIAAHLGIGKNTVFRYLRTATLPERRRRRDGGHSVLNPYKPYLLGQ